MVGSSRNFDDPNVIVSRFETSQCFNIFNWDSILGFYFRVGFWGLVGFYIEVGFNRVAEV